MYFIFVKCTKRCFKKFFRNGRLFISWNRFFRQKSKPYDDYEAKSWFKEAFDSESKGDLNKALSLYEKFTKRRSDAVIKINGTEWQVGPEALIRAAKIRERKGDWSKTFNHLKLIAKAYTDYNFEVIADYLMVISEKLANENFPKSGFSTPISLRNRRSFKIQ